MGADATFRTVPPRQNASFKLSYPISMPNSFFGSFGGAGILGIFPIEGIPTGMGKRSLLIVEFQSAFVCGGLHTDKSDQYQSVRGAP